jgi:predicted nucleotidyltransferase
MKKIQTIKQILEQHKSHLKKKYHLKKIGVFGSYVREEQQADSDIDILVEFDQPIGIEFIDLALELEEILGTSVDLVSKNGVKAKYLPYIEKDLEYV